MPALVVKKMSILGVFLMWEFLLFHNTLYVTFCFVYAVSRWGRTDIFSAVCAGPTQHTIRTAFYQSYQRTSRTKNNDADNNLKVCKYGLEELKPRLMIGATYTTI